jgi:hypothetical protein
LTSNTRAEIRASGGIRPEFGTKNRALVTGGRANAIIAE